MVIPAFARAWPSARALSANAPDAPSSIRKIRRWLRLNVVSSGWLRSIPGIANCCRRFAKDVVDWNCLPDVHHPGDADVWAPPAAEGGAAPLRVEGAKRRKILLQRLICLGPGLSYGIRTGACSLNGEESQIMQSDRAQDGLQIRRQKIRLTRALPGKSSARGYGDKDRTVAQRADFSFRGHVEGPADRTT